jgi:hypothetical protein
MFNALEYSLKITREIMLPYINKANDLNACIAFLEKFNLPISTNSFKLNSNFDGCDYHDEGFLYIKTDYKELKEKWKKILNGETDTTDEMREKIAVKYKFFDDPIIQKKALEEIERRKVDNTERLSSYGFDVKKR